MRLTVWLSRPDPASANCVDAQGQIFGKGAMEWKVGTCSGHHTTALSGGEGARSQQYLILRRSEEHTSELQSLMRISYAVFCLKKKKKKNIPQKSQTHTHKTREHNTLTITTLMTT